MPARRPPSRTFNADRLIQALTENQEDLYRKFEQKIEAVESTLEQSIRLVQTDVRLEGQERKLLASELSSLQMQVGDLRDAVHLQKTAEAARAAREAARITAPIAAQETVRAVTRKIQWPQWVAVAGVIFMVLATFAEKAPTTLRFIEGTWKAWSGADAKK